MAKNSRSPGTARLTGTAILAALVIVFDYALKFSGLKIPFPWMPFLKFDFTGVPIVVALLLFGLSPAATTSVVASLGIVARSGDLIGGAMKGIAELSTVAGMAAGLRIAERFSPSRGIRMAGALAAGVVTRILVMSAWNLLVLPNFYGVPFNATIGMLPLLALFNAMQGAMTVALGYTLHDAYVRRVPAQNRPTIISETPPPRTDCFLCPHESII
jgi:riboflavin transporter FmnP